MTYREAYEKAEWKLERGEITIGEFDEMTKPLDEEIRPHGEWVLDAVSPHSISWFRCSYCGYKYDAYKQSNFCPNCGADMREGDENG